MANFGLSNLYGIEPTKKPMWDDLSSDTRQRMTDAGITPDTYFMADEASVNPYMATPESSLGSKWDSLGMKDQASIGLGIGQLGLGLAGYLDQTKTAKTQRELMGQQIASNRDLLATRKARAGDINKAFGSGLAATAA